MNFNGYTWPPLSDADPISVVHKVDLDGDKEALLVGLYEAVAEGVGVDPGVDNIPIEEQLDPTALSSVFTEESGSTFVTFRVWDVWVTVHSDGSILVYPDE